MFIPRTLAQTDGGPGRAAVARAVFVGGLLALELGRVPLPGAAVVSHGLRLQAEGSRDSRGRVRISTVLVSPASPAQCDGEEISR